VFSANQQVFVWQGLPPTVTWFALGEQSLPNHWYQTLWAGISDGSRGQQVFPSASNSSKLNPGNYVVRSFNANNQIVGECPFSVR
jgi:hypothetical protein